MALTVVAENGAGFTMLIRYKSASGCREQRAEDVGEHEARRRAGELRRGLRLPGVTDFGMGRCERRTQRRGTWQSQTGTRASAQQQIPEAGRVSTWSGFLW